MSLAMPVLGQDDLDRVASVGLKRSESIVVAVADDA